jgi:AraC-like DNA-binding protein
MLSQPVKKVFFKQKMQTLLPHPSIAGFVKNIVILEDSHLPGDLIVPLIAKGYPNITFQSTGPGRIDGRNNDRNALVLYGQNVEPIQFHASGHLTVIAYFLFPHVLNSLFGFGGAEVKDLGIDLNQLPPAKGNNLKEQLVNASSLSMRLELMNRFIFELSRLTRKDMNSSLGYAVNAIQDSRGLISLKDIQNELCITERSFQRLFTSGIGVPPKVYSRICQFQSAFQQLNSGLNVKLSAIAYDNGYADQSHMNRAFKEFTDCSPLDYLQRSTEF